MGRQMSLCASCIFHYHLWRDECALGSAAAWARWDEARLLEALATHVRRTRKRQFFFKNSFQNNILLMVPSLNALAMLLLEQGAILRAASWEMTPEGEQLVNSLLEALSFPALLDDRKLRAAFCKAFSAVGRLCLSANF